MTKKIGLLLIFLIGSGVALFLYTHSSKKDKDEILPKKLSLATVSSQKSAIIAAVKEDKNREEYFPAKTKNKATPNQPRFIESEPQHENGASSEPAKLVALKSNQESVLEAKEKAPVTKKEKREMMLQQMKELVDMVNISSSMEIYFEDEKMMINHSEKPSTIIPDSRFIQLKNGDYYLGYLNEKGKPEGLGIFIYQDHSIYEGLIKDGIRDGMGKFTDPEGTVTLGDWQNDKYVDKSKEIPAKKKGAYKVAIEDPHFYIGHWEKKLTYEESAKHEVLWMDFSLNSSNELVLAKTLRERSTGKLNVKDVSHEDTLSWIKAKLKIVNDDVLYYRKNKYEFKRLSKRILAPKDETKRYSINEKATSTNIKK